MQAPESKRGNGQRTEGHRRTNTLRRRDARVRSRRRARERAGGARPTEKRTDSRGPKAEAAGCAEERTAEAHSGGRETCRPCLEGQGWLSGLWGPRERLGLPSAVTTGKGAAAGPCHQARAHGAREWCRPSLPASATLSCPTHTWKGKEEPSEPGAPG